MCFLLASCGSSKLTTYSVAYQSVRTRHAQPTASSPIPDEAKIAVVYTISNEGMLTAIVCNRTSEIMTIDQTTSFFVNSDGESKSYYDPTVRTTSTTNMSSKQSGASVNLGSIAGALGIGGILGQMANGVNVGGSGTKGTAVTNATYVADMPRVSIAPYGKGAMSKVYSITGIGDSFKKGNHTVQPNLSEKDSYCHFSVCISYSLDRGITFEKIVTDFYADSRVIIPVAKHGKVNDALRTLYTSKPDCLGEPWYLFTLNNNLSSYNDYFSNGVIYDYQ